MKSTIQSPKSKILTLILAFLPLVTQAIFPPPDTNGLPLGLFVHGIPCPGGFLHNPEWPTNYSVTCTNGLSHPWSNWTDTVKICTNDTVNCVWDHNTHIGWPVFEADQHSTHTNTEFSYGVSVYPDPTNHAVAMSFTVGMSNGLPVIPVVNPYIVITCCLDTSSTSNSPFPWPYTNSQTLLCLELVSHTNSSTNVFTIWPDSATNTMDLTNMLPVFPFCTNIDGSLCNSTNPLSVPTSVDLNVIETIEDRIENCIYYRDTKYLYEYIIHPADPKPEKKIGQSMFIPMLADGKMGSKQHLQATADLGAGVADEPVIYFAPNAKWYWSNSIPISTNQTAAVFLIWANGRTNLFWRFREELTP
ncbi:MAG TPA: hypothetical protein VN578_02510 [Candidatus Binatia bacterium]|jgi:hypothetical protein|nr:hypothetical protein [Candidatus Binatia bacterium]